MESSVWTSWEVVFGTREDDRRATRCCLAGLGGEVVTETEEGIGEEGEVTEEKGGRGKERGAGLEVEGGGEAHHTGACRGAGTGPSLGPGPSWCVVVQ